MWKKLEFANGEKGSENGIIIRDEEYKSSCRITLEKCSKYYAITCGVYGAMVHTTFCDEKDSNIMFETMKKELAEFVEKETTEDEEIAFYCYFTSKY